MLLSGISTFWAVATESLSAPSRATVPAVTLTPVRNTAASKPV